MLVKSKGLIVISAMIGLLSAVSAFPLAPNHAIYDHLGSTATLQTRGERTSSLYPTTLAASSSSDIFLKGRSSDTQGPSTSSDNAELEKLKKILTGMPDKFKNLDSNLKSHLPFRNIQEDLVKYLEQYADDEGTRQEVKTWREETSNWYKEAAKVQPDVHKAVQESQQLLNELSETLEGGNHDLDLARAKFKSEGTRLLRLRYRAQKADEELTTRRKEIDSFITSPDLARARTELDERIRLVGSIISRSRQQNKSAP